MRKGLHTASLVLSVMPSSETDQEAGILANSQSESDWLVKQQIRKAQETLASPIDATCEQSEMEVLKTACSGPVEMFEHLGKTRHVYLSILGPPQSRRWVMGIWNDKSEMDNKQRAIKEVDLLRVQTVQADP